MSETHERNIFKPELCPKVRMKRSVEAQRMLFINPFRGAPFVLPFKVYTENYRDISEN